MKLLRLVKLCRLSIVSIIVELKIDQYNYTDKTDNISQIVNISDIDSRISVLKNLKISWPQDEPLLVIAESSANLTHNYSFQVNAKSLSDLIRELATVSPAFFKEDNRLFSYQNKKTKSNILMELAKSAKDDALREILVNRQTYR